MKSEKNPKGAGRKPSEPTKQVRIAIAASAASRKLTDYYLDKARRIWEEHYGTGFMVSLFGVEERKFGSIMGGSFLGLVIVAHAEKENLRSIFTINFDNGKDGFVYESEEEI